MLWWKRPKDSKAKNNYTSVLLGPVGPIFLRLPSSWLVAYNKHMANTTILVTGGAGFIGSNLIEELLKDSENKVISLDNYFVGTKENHIGGAVYTRGHTKNIGELTVDTPNIIYHLGEYSRVEQSFDDIDTVWDLNIHGTFSVLEYCRKNTIRLVYAGSSTKFADNGLGRYQSPYAWTKANNTDLIKNYGEWFGISFAITYFYNVYGPRERSGKYGTVIEVFKDQYRAKKPITVRAPGSQRRNFTHVDDIVNGLLLIGEKGEGDEYGLGSEESYSIMEVAEMFGNDTRMIPNRRGNRQDAEIDLTKSRTLGWKTKNHLKDYIKSFVNAIKI